MSLRDKWALWAVVSAVMVGIWFSGDHGPLTLRNFWPAWAIVPWAIVLILERSARGPDA